MPLRPDSASWKSHCGPQAAILPVAPRWGRSRVDESGNRKAPAVPRWARQSVAAVAALRKSWCTGEFVFRYGWLSCWRRVQDVDKSQPRLGLLPISHDTRRTGTQGAVSRGLGHSSRLARGRRTSGWRTPPTTGSAAALLSKRSHLSVLQGSHDAPATLVPGFSLTRGCEHLAARRCDAERGRPWNTRSE